MEERSIHCGWVDWPELRRDVLARAAGAGEGDGAMLFLTVARFADRRGEVYGGPLVPGVPVDGGPESLGTPLAEDPVVAAAADWLEARPACR